MAKNTAKANMKSNAKRLRLFAAVTAATAAVYWLAHYWLWPTPGFSGRGGVELACLGFWLTQEIGAILLLRRLGRPARDPQSGALLDCADLSDPAQLGVYSHAQDVLWLCWAAQLLGALVWKWLVLVYYIAPASVVYAAWTGVIRPLLAARNAGGGGGGIPGVAGHGGADAAGLDAAAVQPQPQPQRKVKVVRR